jgi:hypothetical protein
MAETNVYPSRPGTVTDDGILTISQYLQSPEFLTRRLRDITEQQFVGDRILTGRATARGGMVGYEVSESIFAENEPETIEPGGEFPTTKVGVGRSVLEAIKKIGLATEVTRESVLRSSWQPVDRAERKLRNNIIRAFDMVVMRRIATAAPQMRELAGSPWSESATSIVRQVLTAKAMLDDDREGYNADTLLLDHFLWVELASNERLLTMLQRYGGNDSPVTVTNRIELPGLGLTILPHPSDTPLEDPVVYDSQLLGSIVSEAGNDDQ